MVSISGHVYFDRLRNMTAHAPEDGIAGVAVVLQNINFPYEGMAVQTDSEGRYSFVEVPAGEYRLVEAYGEPAVPTPGNFTDAVPGGLPTAALPPIGYVPNPPQGANRLDCLTPATLFVTVTTEDIDGKDFINGPVAHIAIDTIMDSCTEIMPANLMVDADYGTIGSFPAGTPANSAPQAEPYPAVTPDFVYVMPDPAQYIPDDGQYTVQNIMNNSMSNRIGSWWRIADRTTGTEQGRMMVVNGYDPGSCFFVSEMTVKPNTYYLFSVWILNMFRVTGYSAPALGVLILGETGQTLYEQTLGQLIPVNTDCPEWRQLGTVLNSGENSRLTLKFVSQGPAAWGNDYAIDDIELHEITVPVFVPVKTIDKAIVAVDEIVTYTVTLYNSCSLPLTNVNFVDALPPNLSFVRDSVTINGAPAPDRDPVAGFVLPDIAGGGYVTVSFQATAVSVPAVNPVINENLVFNTM